MYVTIFKHFILKLKMFKLKYIKLVFNNLNSMHKIDIYYNVV